MAPNEANAVPQVQIISRVTSLPMVASALGYATDGYSKIKSYNPLLESTLSRAESTINYVNEAAVKPVVSKLEKPISYADNFVCKGMDKLEEKVPAVKKAPEEIMNEGWEKLEEVKKIGEERAKELKDYSYERFNAAMAGPLVVSLRKSVDSAMDLTEQAVEQFLPPVDDEPQEERSENVVHRMSNLSDKMRRRVSKRGLAHYQAIQKRSGGAIQRLTQSVNLIQAAKDIREVGLQQVSKVSADVQNKVTWLWSELLKDEVQEAGDEPKTLEQRLLSMARVTTHEVISQYKKLAGVSKYMPDTFNSALEASTQYATDFYHQLSNASSLKDVSDLTLKQMSAGLESMQSLVSEAFPILRRNSAPAQVPAHEGDAPAAPQ